MLPPPPSSPLFPYTTLFRSHPPCALTRLISVSRCDSSTPQHTTRQLSKSESVASRKPKVISLAAYALRLASDDDRAWKVRATLEAFRSPGLRPGLLGTPERRRSSRRFPYVYLVTTSPQS